MPTPFARANHAYKKIPMSINRLTISHDPVLPTCSAVTVTASSLPRAMHVIYLLAIVCLGNLEVGGMPIGYLLKLFHHTNQLVIVSWNTFPALIQTRFPRRGCPRPVRIPIGLLHSLLLPQLTQADKRLMAHAECIVALVDNHVSHVRLSLGWIRRLSGAHRTSSVLTGGTSMTGQLRCWRGSLVFLIFPRPTGIPMVGPGNHRLLMEVSIPHRQDCTECTQSPVNLDQIFLRDMFPHGLEQPLRVVPRIVRIAPDSSWNPWCERESLLPLSTTQRTPGMFRLRGQRWRLWSTNGGDWGIGHAGKDQEA